MSKDQNKGTALVGDWLKTKGVPKNTGNSIWAPYSEYGSALLCYAPWIIYYLMPNRYSPTVVVPVKFYFEFRETLSRGCYGVNFASVRGKNKKKIGDRTASGPLSLLFLLCSPVLLEGETEQLPVRVERAR